MKKFILLLLLAIFATGCVEDANNCFGCQGYDNPIRKYKIEFRGHSSSEVQYPVSIIYFKDDRDAVMTSEIVSSQTSADVIETREFYSFDKLGFKLSVASGGQALVNTVIITDVEANQVIFENHSLNVATGKTFMYTISTGSYTISN